MGAVADTKETGKGSWCDDGTSSKSADSGLQLPAMVRTPSGRCARTPNSWSLISAAVCAFGAFFNGLVIVINLGASGVLTSRLHGAVYVSCFNSMVAASMELLLLAVWSGLACLGVAPPLSPRSSCTELRHAPCWVWLGGLLSAYTLTAGIFVAARVGVALSTMTILTGNLLTSVFVETFGFGGQPQRRFSALKVAGLLLVISGAACVATADSGENESSLGVGWTALDLVLLLAVGTCVPLLATANGRLCDLLGLTLRAAFCSDLITAGSLLIVCIVYAVASPPDVGALWDAPAWSFIGGPCSVCFTCILIVVPRRIGVAGYACACIAGQQLFGVLVDALGLFAVQRAASPARLVGSAVSVGGAVLFQLASAKAVKSGHFLGSQPPCPCPQDQLDVSQC